MLVLRFERFFAGKKCADPAGAKRLPQDAYIRRYKKNRAKIPERSPAVQAAGRKRGDGCKKKSIKNAVHTREKRSRSKRIKIIAKKC